MGALRGVGLVPRYGSADNGELKVVIKNKLHIEESSQRVEVDIEGNEISLRLVCRCIYTHTHTHHTTHTTHLLPHTCL